MQFPWPYVIRDQQARVICLSVAIRLTIFLVQRFALMMQLHLQLLWLERCLCYEAGNSFRYLHLRGDEFCTSTRAETTTYVQM